MTFQIDVANEIANEDVKKLHDRYINVYGQQ